MRSVCVGSRLQVSTPNQHSFNKPWLRSGLTLLDVVIAVLILGIMSMAAVPRYTGLLHQYRVEAAAERLVADLQLVRNNAYACSETRSVLFNPSQVSYQIPSSTTVARDGVVDLSAAPYYLTGLTVVPSEITQVDFDAFGHASGSVAVWLELGQNKRVVTIPSNGAAFEISTE